nr:immunoglobulin heavy chain junction region [Mus musculus]
CGRGEVLDYW